MLGPNILFRTSLHVLHRKLLKLCILFNHRDATYTVFFIIISAQHVLGRFFRPSSGAYKTACAALGIVMLSCCLPRVSSNPTTPVVDSSKE
jgi:hypothetical protein